MYNTDMDWTPWTTSGGTIFPLYQTLRTALGCTIRKNRSIQRNPRGHYMQRWPSPKAMKKLRDRVGELTSRKQSGKDVKQLIAELTPVLRGWGNYFRTGNAWREF